MTLDAGWAIVGKEPGSHDDYTVLRSNEVYFTSASYSAILRRFTPGTPSSRPPSTTCHRDSLPWITISYAPHGSGTMLGIAERTWSDDLDGAGRLIAKTTYVCIPFTSLQDTPVSYVDLRAAVRTALTNGLSANGRPLRLDIRCLDPPRVASDVEEFGFRFVAGTAALVLAGGVALLGAPADTSLDRQADRRLRFLDAVAALLPYGQRSKLVASTWADGSTTHRIRLGFSDRAHPTQSIIRWEGPRAKQAATSLPTMPDEATEYLDVLVDMHTRLLVDMPDRPVDATTKLVEHLVRYTEGRLIGDPTHALLCLAELDLKVFFEPRIRSGTATAMQLCWLLEGGKIERLDRSDAHRAVTLLIESADVAGLPLAAQTWLRWHEIREVNQKEWQDLTKITSRTARDLLWLSSPDLSSPELVRQIVPKVNALTDLADTLGFSSHLLARMLDVAMARRGSDDIRKRQSASVTTDPARHLPDTFLHDRICATATARVLRHQYAVGRLGGDATGPVDTEVRKMLSRGAANLVPFELMRQAILSDSAENDGIRWLEWLEHSPRLRSDLRPFRDVVDGCPDDKTLATAGKWDNEYAVALSSLARSTATAHLLIPILRKWLRKRAPELSAEGSRRWADEVSRWTSASRADEAHVDLLQLALGQPPRVPLRQRVETAQAHGYAQSFLREFGRLKDEQGFGPASVLLDRLASAIATDGWPQAATAVALMLELLYKLARYALPVGEPLAEVVNRLFETDSIARRAKYAKPWRELIADRPRTRR